MLKTYDNKIKRMLYSETIEDYENGVYIKNKS